MGIDWDRVAREQQSGRHRVYQKRLCPHCGRLISESAYSGGDGNWKKHAKACEARQKGGE